MSFFQKIRSGLRNFMLDRHGTDELSLALLILGVFLSLLSSLSRIGLFYLLGLAAYGFSIYRIFSRNHEKRTEENSKFTTGWRSFRLGIRQFFIRLKNLHKYRYFKCPECHARLRLPRKVGEVTVTCGKCKHTFRQKA